MERELGIEGENWFVSIHRNASETNIAQRT